MEESAAVPPSSQSAASLKPLLEECGYTGARLETRYRLGDVVIPLVGFASSERDMDSACIAVVDGGSNPEAAVRSCLELAAPVVWVRHNGSVDWWVQRHGTPTRFDSRPADEFPSLVREYKDKLDHNSIYLGRTLARINPAKQLDFVDAGLLPLRREEAGQKLHDTVESMIVATLRAMGRQSPPKNVVREVFKAVFRMLAGKILRDKKVRGFGSLNLNSPTEVLKAVTIHYDKTGAIKPRPSFGYGHLRGAAAILNDAPNFAVVSPESLAYVYEHTLVTRELRKKLGIHATPPWLVDYMVWQLYDWVREIPVEDRHVFEPACGHAPFLLSMMRLLRMELDDLPSDEVHEYLKQHLVGIEFDAFASEIARPSLTLADIPNSNGWRLLEGDMYSSDVLARETANCRILLSNPPYAKFDDREKARCKKAGHAVKYKKAVELITRTIDKLTPGAVFGFVVPQTVISGPEAKHIREFLLNECELAEVCRFPGKVFAFAQIETAIILGRRNLAGTSSAMNRVRIRTVGERGMAAFQHNYAVDEDTSATQEQLLEHPALELMMPALNEVWETLKRNPRVRDVAVVGRGIEYKGKTARKGKPVESRSKRAGFMPGYAGVGRREQAVYTPPPSCWLATDEALIGNPRQGRATGTPQVLVNMGRTSRLRWRIKPLLDEAGLDVKNNFAIIRPAGTGEHALYLWAVLNSPIANAFVASRTMRKHNYEGILGDVPMPLPNQRITDDLVSAASAYRELARKRDAELATHKSAAATRATLFTEPEPEVSVTPESAVRDALLKLDAAVLRAYALPVRLERQLLDYFNGNIRAGVGCTFGDYYPADFKSLVPLHKYVSAGYRGSTVDQVAARMKPDGTSAGTAALRTAAEAFGGDDDKAARYARASALLDQWASEEGDFDARIGPRIEKAIKDTAPRHNPD
ncbi:MAG: N-6 DNA methylase [Phycisphaeraceae bacterium]|nr:N-6 DNA methylase [Phycisphaeraceae bacterium]